MGGHGAVASQHRRIKRRGKEALTPVSHCPTEVKEVEQVLGPEEEVAIDEFAKFEARLRGEGKTVEI